MICKSKLQCRRNVCLKMSNALFGVGWEAVMGYIWLCIPEIVEGQSILSRNGKMQCLEEQHCLWNKRCRAHGLCAEAFPGHSSHCGIAEGERQCTNAMWYFWKLWLLLQQGVRGWGPSQLPCFVIEGKWWANRFFLSLAPSVSLSFSLSPAFSHLQSDTRAHRALAQGSLFPLQILGLLRKTFTLKMLNSHMMGTNTKDTSNSNHGKLNKAYKFSFTEQINIWINILSKFKGF